MTNGFTKYRHLVLRNTDISCKSADLDQRTKKSYNHDQELIIVIIIIILFVFLSIRLSVIPISIHHAITNTQGRKIQTVPLKFELKTV